MFGILALKAAAVFSYVYFGWIYGERLGRGRTSLGRWLVGALTLLAIQSLWQTIFYYLNLPLNSFTDALSLALAVLCLGPLVIKTHVKEADRSGFGAASLALDHRYAASGAPSSTLCHSRRLACNNTRPDTDALAATPCSHTRCFCPHRTHRTSRRLESACNVARNHHLGTRSCLRAIHRAADLCQWLWF
jgi:hypothetical protein